MDRPKKAALLMKLIGKLRERGSWCGETHVQKVTYFAQKVAGMKTGFDFILYKHGPFSFDLRDELTGLRADGFLTLESQWPYGPRISLTEQSEYIQNLYPKTLRKYEEGIEFVARHLGERSVVELERLATALYVGGDREDGASIEARAKRVSELKPHISLEEARDAVREVDRIVEEATCPTR